LFTSTSSRPKRVDLVADRHVADRPADAVAVVGEPPRGGFEAVASPVGQQHSGPGLGEPSGRGEAEALRGAGDERDAAAQLEKLGDRWRGVRVGAGGRRDHQPHHSTSIWA
jgi:hypothetical protein